MTKDEILRVLNERVFEFQLRTEENDIKERYEYQFLDDQIFVGGVALRKFEIVGDEPECRLVFDPEYWGPEYLNLQVEYIEDGIGKSFVLNRTTFKESTPNSLVEIATIRQTTEQV